MTRAFKTIRSGASVGGFSCCWATSGGDQASSREREQLAAGRAVWHSLERLENRKESTISQDGLCRDGRPPGKQLLGGAIHLDVMFEC